MWQFLVAQSSAILDVAQALGIFSTLVFLIIQILKNTSAVKFDIHQRLNDRYTEILWRAVELPVLNGAWDPLDPQRKKELDEAQRQKVWGAWYALNDDEKKQYRFTRLTLEIFEQAFVALEYGWIERDMWRKWESTIRIWKGSRFYTYVIEDTGQRISANFLRALERIR